MTAGDYWMSFGVLTTPAGENIADAVNGDVTSGITTPLHEHIPALFILIGQRQATAAAFRGSAILGHVHQAIPKALSIYVYIPHVSPIGELSS